MRKTILFVFLILALALSACTAKTPAPAVEPQTAPTAAPTVPKVQPTEPPAAEPAQTVNLEGTSWQWTGVTLKGQTTQVETPENYTLTFEQGGLVQIQADCNSASGEYSVEGSTASITVGPMTRMACPEGSRSDEFVALLNLATSVTMDGENLVLGVGEGGTMEFAPYTPAAEAAPENELVGTDWQWVYFTGPDAKTSVDTPENYTLSFKEGGAVDIKADCNKGAGTYEVNGSELKITLGPTTLAACAPESLSDQYLQYLGTAASYAIENGNLFIDLADDGGRMEFIPAGSTQEARIQQALVAEPFEGTLNLGGGEGKWLDPALLSALGGSFDGRTVDVSRLKEGCVGYMPTKPDAVINWEAQENVDKLRFFFLSMGDPSMVIVTPSGKALCSDDLNPLVRDPYIEVENPEAGKYLAFLGTYDQNVNYPGFLVVTTKDLNPATMDIAKMFPRQVDPRGVPEQLALTVLKTEGDDVAKLKAVPLANADLPSQQEVTGGGEIGAFNLQQPNQACTGFVSALPSFRFEWTGDTNPIAMFVESDVDTTLVVRAPDGTFICGDDVQGDQNVNPYVTLEPQAGVYNVWVGGFAPGFEAKGMLTITSDQTAQPAALPHQ